VWKLFAPESSWPSDIVWASNGDGIVDALSDLDLRAPRDAPNLN
jgi:hypothetical protein